MPSQARPRPVARLLAHSQCRNNALDSWMLRGRRENRSLQGVSEARPPPPSVRSLQFGAQAQPRANDEGFAALARSHRRSIGCGGWSRGVVGIAERSKGIAGMAAMLVLPAAAAKWVVQVQQDGRLASRRSPLLLSATGSMSMSKSMSGVMALGAFSSSSSSSNGASSSSMVRVDSERRDGIASPKLRGMATMAAATRVAADLGLEKGIAMRKVRIGRSSAWGTASGLGSVSLVERRVVTRRVQSEERQAEERESEELVEEKEEQIFPENSLSNWLYPPEEELPDDKEMTIFDHLEELRDRLLISVVAVGIAIVGCFVFAKDLIVLLEKPVYSLGVRFLALSPGEYFFTTLKVSGYCGLLLGSPVILYEIISFVVPGLTRSEKKLLGPVVLGSSFLFYAGLAFSYAILTPAALNFFVSYAEGVVESLWSIDQYFEFVLVLMFSTGLSFQVPVIQLLLGQTGLVSGDQMLSVWRYVVVGAVIAAAVLTPSTDPLTQCLLAGPLIGLYMGGAFTVKFLVNSREPLELED